MSKVSEISEGMVESKLLIARGSVMKRLLIKANRNLSVQERLRRIMEIQQMESAGVVILEPDFEVIPEENTWYKAKEAWPSPFADILFCDASGEMYLGTMDELKRFVDKSGSSIDDVVAWMPAPERFEEEKND